MELLGLVYYVTNYVMQSHVKINQSYNQDNWNNVNTLMLIENETFDNEE